MTTTTLCQCTQWKGYHLKTVRRPKGVHGKSHGKENWNLHVAGKNEGDKFRKQTRRAVIARDVVGEARFVFVRQERRRKQRNVSHHHATWQARSIVSCGTRPNKFRSHIPESPNTGRRRGRSCDKKKLLMLLPWHSKVVSVMLETHPDEQYIMS